MSNNDKRDANWSLQGEIKKRKTQEIQREILEKRSTQSMRPAQANGSGSTTSPSESSLPKRATQTMPPVGADPRRTSQTMQQVDPRRTSQTMQQVDPRRTSQTMQQVDPRRTSQTMQQVDSRRTSQTMQALGDSRRTSQTMAPVEPRRASQTMPQVDPRRTSQTMRQVDPRRTSQMMQQVDPRRTSQTMAAVQSLVDSKRVSQTVQAVQETGRMLRVTAEDFGTSVGTMKPAQKRAVVASLVGVITLIALMSSVLMIGRAVAPPTRVVDGTAYVIQPTLGKLPSASAQDFVDYLKRFGVPVFNQTQEVITSRWHAAQEISFQVPYGTQGTSAKFYVLGYDPSNKYMGFDLMFFSAFRPPFSDLAGWQYMTASNVLVITPPTTPPQIVKLVMSHFNSMLLAPGMSNYPKPTSTPTPGPTPTPTS